MILAVAVLGFYLVDNFQYPNALTLILSDNPTIRSGMLSPCNLSPPAACRACDAAANQS